MNIDTLRTSTGYRNAEYTDIVRCLQAGHTTHLQTARGTMAFRPASDRGFTVSRCVPGQKQQSMTFEYGMERRIIRAALEFLNGTTNPYRPGDDLEIEANQGRRPGYVLATRGDDCLVEYEMPAGTTALKVVTVLGHRKISQNKTISYNAVPRVWLRAIRDAGMTNWIGRGQRSRTPIAFPFHLITE